MTESGIFEPVKLLREHGFRTTPKKVAILNALKKTNRPLTIAELHNKIGRLALDKATLYRNLESFVSAGIARRVFLQKGRAHYYELAGEHHHHLVCLECGKIKDVKICDFEKKSKQALEQAKGFESVESHVFEMVGICKPCAQTN